jgi:anaerobic selenocysteine-containing dehydrogenase/Fe-S-cluster-containing dehydrogenase component
MKEDVGMSQGKEIDSIHRLLPGVGAPQEVKGVSRRRFLQIVGTATAATTVVGCADDKAQTLIPRVRSEDGQIPGVPVWFSSTCTECSAGCGIQVKTVDGRAIKIEGNVESPINKGSLCALGQASLQHLYDPDRVREPLKRTFDKNNRPQFVPVSWDEALKATSDALKASKKRNVIVTGEIGDSLASLINEFSKACKVDAITFDPFEPVALARATQKVFGVYGVPRYSFENAECVVNFGAEFLETWVSPCEYAREWSRSRRSEKPFKFIQIESRLSLTGANADKWVRVDLGKEYLVARALLAQVFQGRKGRTPPQIRSLVEKILKDFTPDQFEKETGVPIKTIVDIASILNECEHSLVLGGGLSANTTHPLPFLVVVHLINVVLGNVGRTVHLDRMRVPRSSVSQLKAAIDDLKSDKVGVLITYDTNPAFTLPSSFEFSYATKRAELSVAFASHLDETAFTADYVLPTNVGLESWGDVKPYAGVKGIVQPVMAPLFDTREVGDLILTLANQVSSSFSTTVPYKTFQELVKARWLSDGTVSQRGKDETKWWIETVEKGGIFSDAPRYSSPDFGLSDSIQSLEFTVASLNDVAIKGSEKKLTLLPFASIKSFDGRAANRPWLQELPDPITQIVWDSWVEIHPETAATLGEGIAQGTPLTIRNFFGEITAPAYLTEYIAPGVVGVPVGQGHREYGRFAKMVGGGNVIDLLPPVVAESDAGSVAHVATTVAVSRAPGFHSLVVTSGSSSQEDRGLAKTRILDGAPKREGEGAHSDSHDDSRSASHDDSRSASHGADHHEPKQMYEQREHPLYKWGMTVDLAACTGCSACVVACYAENNIPVVGKKLCEQGREMSWIRIERYFDSVPSEELRVSFLPMMCQHCNNAPCEPVCPVYATYHNEEGMNVMVYNRCVGTRYCSNNCSYKVRRFNWVDIEFPEPMQLQLNPYVTKRTMGVMEKCSFCMQRISDGKDKAKDLGRAVRDGEIVPACVQSCPTQALTFGNLNDSQSRVSKLSKHDRSYKVLDHHINTQPSVSYLEDVKYKI